MEFGLPEFTKGDYMEFRAEMDLVCALSACPAEEGYNGYDPKSLKAVVYE